MAHKKPEGERVRRNKPVPITLVKWDGVARGPELPLGLRGIKWSTRTLQWWRTWRESSQAMYMTPIDWEFMLETAMVHNSFWSPRSDAVLGKEGKIKRVLVPRTSTDLKNLSGELRQRLSYIESVVKRRLDEGERIVGPSVEDRVDVIAEESVNYWEDLTKEAARQRKIQEAD